MAEKGSYPICLYSVKFSPSSFICIYVNHDHVGYHIEKSSFLCFYNAYGLVFDDPNGIYDEETDIVVGLTQTGFTVGSGNIIGDVNITTNKVDIIAPYLLTMLGLLSLAVIAISIRKRKH
ncbi:hypothetical protein A3K80_03055 [Candidatus Bathyarchaeota archaeon RBG_13_38_9]|nr:MAG: hypothetical protein A3K80_03055 [Candidatus Bathyarchaeota archaeon RBG_13_38_9]